MIERHLRRVHELGTEDVCVAHSAPAPKRETAFGPLTATSGVQPDGAQVLGRRRDGQLRVALLIVLVMDARPGARGDEATHVELA